MLERPLRLSPLLGPLFVTCVVGHVGVALGAESATTFVPRDAIVKVYTSYSAERTCNERLLGGLHITREECAKRVENAKRECPAEIVDGLPMQLNEKQLFMLVGRSPWCLMRKLEDAVYRNSDYDPTNEKLWAEHQHG